MRDAFEDTTSIAGTRIGLHRPELLDGRIKFLRAMPLVAAIPVVFLLLAGFFSPLPMAAALGVGGLLLIAGLAAWAVPLVKVPVLVPDHAVVYYSGRWYRSEESPIWVPTDDLARSKSRPKQLNLRPQRATWRTKRLRTVDGYTVTYDVDLTVELDPDKLDDYLHKAGAYPEELIFFHIEQMLVAEVSQTGEADRSGFKTPGVQRTRYMEKLQDMALQTGRPSVTGRGVTLHEVYIHNAQVEHEEGALATADGVRHVSSGEIEVMNDNELLSTLKTDYGLVVPEIFDPIAIKTSLEALRNRKQPTLVTRFIRYLSGRVPTTQHDLLKAWEEYYTQVGATLEANHAAQKKLETAEVNHRLFLEESMAKVHDHRATVAEADARVMEAQVRKVKAVKDMMDTFTAMSRSSASVEKKKLSREEQASAILQEFNADVEEIQRSDDDEESKRKRIRHVEHKKEQKMKQLYGS